MEKKVVIFGAGKIGRSFIGQLFSASGYEVVFIDTQKEIINQLNEKKSYSVVIKSNQGDEFLNIENVRGILAQNEDDITDELSTCTLACLSVGQKALPYVVPVLAKGIKKRVKKMNGLPLDIVIAENLRNAADYIRNLLLEALPNDIDINKTVGLVETSIGKMVPIMARSEMEKDPLLVYAEPYNTLILDAKAFKNPIPGVKGLAPKQNIKAWVDRKLFIHNLGHAVAAYIGNYHIPKAKYMYEVLSDSLVKKLTLHAMHESAKVLQQKYPGEFNNEALESHINDLVARFQNKALGDTVFRVGCDLPRKLGAEDRLACPIKIAESMRLDFDTMLLAYSVSARFKAKGPDGKRPDQDKLVNKEFKQKGIDFILSKYGKFQQAKNETVYKRSALIHSTLSI
jgi:mannitol-1-phosphate 5-dehydrogenase